MPKSTICEPATSLPRKLGLLTASVGNLNVALMGEPAEFQSQLGDLPATVRFGSHIQPDTNLAICFVRSLIELNTLFELLVTQLPPKASVWIARPKQHGKPGFNEHHVRDGGLALGLVDYKIC
ncbi:MAG TPA: hypothetical protein VKV02_02785, partial [Acidobacteriaceae bacterium]|nr:hypothetical protein [Acidobacteriaceae bacterium]